MHESCRPAGSLADFDDIGGRVRSCMRTLETGASCGRGRSPCSTSVLSCQCARMSTLSAQGRAGEKLASCVDGRGQRRTAGTGDADRRDLDPFAAAKQQVMLGAWWGEYSLNGREARAHQAA